MKKRNALHLLVDAILDVEEKTGRVGFLSYSGHTETTSYHFGRSKENYSDWHDGKLFHVETNEDSTESVMRALAHIEQVGNTPLPEENVTVTLTKSKAVEMGLVK